MKQSKTQMIQSGEWKVYSNRARSIVKDSIKAAEDYLQLQHPMTRAFCHEQIKKTTLTYYDTYVGRGKPSTSEPEVHTPIAVRLLPRPVTNLLADKIKLAKSIEQHNLFDYAPKSYFSLKDAINAEGDPDRLMFVKLRSGTRGENVTCVKHRDLENIGASQAFTHNHLIQEEIKNPVLMFNRKTVFRFYILLFDKSVYVSRHGVVVMHGEDYNPTDPNYKAHVQHNGVGNAAVRFPFFKLPYNDVWFEELKKLTQALRPVLDAATSETSMFRYLLIGADAIPCEDGRTRLIELNTHPALIKPPMVEPVYVPVFSSTMLLTVAGLNDNTWVKIT